MVQSKPLALYGKTVEDFFGVGLFGCYFRFWTQVGKNCLLHGGGRRWSRTYAVGKHGEAAKVMAEEYRGYMDRVHQVQTREVSTCQ